MKLLGDILKLDQTPYWLPLCSYSYILSWANIEAFIMISALLYKVYEFPIIVIYLPFFIFF